MSLNKEQQLAYEEVLYGDSKIVLLLAPAGCGKTYTTAQILNDYPGSVSITATTNKAADVLSQMSETPATTTHKQLGFALVTKGFQKSLTQVQDTSVGELLIVEEISMLPRKLYDHIFKLLESGQIKKALMLGDPLQLPAVGNGVNLDEIPGKRIELVQQMRQDGSDQGLADYLSRIRHGIKTGEQVDLKDLQTDAIEFIESHKEFCQLYNQTEGNTKILAYRNNVVDKYNHYINGGVSFNIGDEVIIDKPFRDSSNGETVLVVYVTEDDDRYNITIVNRYGQKGTVYQYKSKARLEEVLAPYEDTNDYEGYWAIMDRVYDLKHVYASTIHKSQGSTYDVVFLDGQDLVSAYTAPDNQYSRSISYEMFLRLFYVGISRMKSKVYIFIGNKRDYRYLLKDR